MATLIDAPPDGALAAAKAYLRIDGGEEDALLATLLAAAIDVAERFTGIALIAADRVAVIPAIDDGWQRLPAAPVAGIAGVSALAADGGETAIGTGGYAIDIDAAGGGWVRVLDAGGARRASVEYRAGLAADWAGVPAALRQGVMRLAAHLHAHRDEGDDAGPPAAVAALWRPFRRMRLS